jgi:hypothetical protein
MNYVRSAVAAALLAIACAASAQQPAAPAAAAIPKPECVRPGEHPGKLGSDNARRAWTRGANAYLECLKKYAADQRALAEPLLSQARPHVDAANAAIDEHNKAANELKAEQDRNS